MQLTQSTIDDLQTDFVLFGLVLNYLFNIFYYFYIYKKKILKDTDYQEWLGKNKIHYNVNLILIILSCSCSFKIHRIVYCRYFGFSFFKAKLESVDEVNDFINFSFFKFYYYKLIINKYINIYI